MNKFKGVFCPRQMRRLTALLIVFAMLFAAVFVVAYAHHDCSGKDCRICEQVQLCLNNLNAFALTAAACGAAVSAFAFFAAVLKAQQEAGIITPVTLKVRLIN